MAVDDAHRQTAGDSPALADQEEAPRADEGTPPTDAFDGQETVAAQPGPEAAASVADLDEGTPATDAPADQPHAGPDVGIAGDAWQKRDEGTPDADSVPPGGEPIADKDQRILPPVRDELVEGRSRDGEYPYGLKQGDLDFLGLTEQQLQDCYYRGVALGLSQEQFDSFRSTLDAQLANSQINDADVRVQGSGAWVYSSQAKPFPRMSPDGRADAQTYQDLGELYGAYNKDAKPADGQIEAIANRLEEWRSGMSDHPHLMPFDAAHKLGLSREASDVDLQVSSDAMLAMCTDTLEQTPGLADRLINEKYGFVNREVFAATFPDLQAWADSQSAAVSRDVAVKLFPGSGPPNKLASGESVSGHFRGGDFGVEPADSSRPYRDPYDYKDEPVDVDFLSDQHGRL